VLSSVNNILTPVNVDNAVTTLASRLGSIYKRENKPQNLVSAASKFLWLRRRSPVVIYDGRAETCLKAMKAKPGATYASYRSAWRAEFPKYEMRIRLACCDLRAPNKTSRMARLSTKSVTSLYNVEVYAHALRGRICLIQTEIKPGRTCELNSSAPA